jgi:hypothetical protein
MHTDVFLKNLFPPPCKPSRCAGCTTTMRRSTNLTNPTRECDRVSSRECVKTAAAHQQRANVSSGNNNAAFVALWPPSNAQLCKALLPVVSLTLERDLAGNPLPSQPKAPCSKRLKEAAACEWRLCAHPLFASSALSRSRRLHVQSRAPTTPSLCKTSNAQLATRSTEIY